MNSCSVFCTQFNIKVINVGQTLHNFFLCCISYDQLGDFDRLQFISITFAYAYALKFHENILDQFWKQFFRIKIHSQLLMKKKSFVFLECFIAWCLCSMTPRRWDYKCLLFRKITTNNKKNSLSKFGQSRKRFKNIQSASNEL